MTALRVHLVNHPLLVMLPLMAVLYVAQRISGGALLRGWARVSRASFIFAGASLLTYAALVVFYCTDPHYFDAAEPTITSVGWLFHLGQPVYHSVDSAERYAHIYGPMAFIAHGVALGVFGPGIEVSKWVGGAAALASLGLIFSAVKTQTDGRRALAITGVCAILLLAFRHYSFWTRAEPLLIFCVAAALLCAVRGRGYLSVVLLGILAGLLWNLKATGVFYSLPVFAIVVGRMGWRPASASALVAAIVAVLPFVALSNVSFSAYVTWFRLSANNGLIWWLFTRNLEWAAYFLVPLLLTVYAGLFLRSGPSKAWMLVTWTTLTAMAIVVVAGSKPGAGPYHLLPFLPVLGYLIASRIGHESPAVTSPIVAPAWVSFVTVAVAIAVAQQAQFVNTMLGRRGLHEIRDIEAFVSQHDGVVEMGYGINDPLTFERPVLVFRNNSYLLDGPAVGEHQLAGIPVPQATLDALRQCRVRYWLIPKGEAPFTATNMYEAVLQPLFSDEFRRVFHETHKLQASTQYFDAWRCQSAH